jgi:hypothetical protein
MNIVSAVRRADFGHVAIAIKALTAHPAAHTIAAAGTRF